MSNHNMECGHCGRTWNDREMPTPSARCPYEYDHEYADTKEMDIHSPTSQGVTITWQIEGDPEDSPLGAVRAVWREYFGRDPDLVGPDEACVFLVKDNATGEEILLDLADIEN